MARDVLETLLAAMILALFGAALLAGWWFA